MFWTITGYAIIGTAVGGITAWNYVLWCVDKSARIIRNSIGDKNSDYTEEEKLVIQNFLDDSLNKLK